jgi:hypothetical protein
MMSDRQDRSAPIILMDSWNVLVIEFLHFFIIDFLFMFDCLPY